MRYYAWNKEKDTWLRENRGIGFENIVDAIQAGHVIDITDHPNPKKYPNQRVVIVNINDYAYEVPFVVDEEKIFFKTIVPSRRATKKYISKE